MAYNEKKASGRNPKEGANWCGSDFIGGIEFMDRHHIMLKIEDGSELLLAIVTPPNPAYPHFRQLKYDDISMRANHGCMLKAYMVVKPCLILSLKFDSVPVKTFREVKMTAVRVNGDMKTPVEIDIDEEASNFQFTENGSIKYTRI